MIDVHRLIKRIDIASVPKNIRISFPNDDIEDLVNKDIASESLSFTESMCSQETLKFGLCEASQVSFDCFDVPNIKGKTIDVNLEVCVDDAMNKTWERVYDGVAKIKIVCGYASDVEVVAYCGGSPIRIYAWYEDDKGNKQRVERVISDTQEYSRVLRVPYIYNGMKRIDNSSQYQIEITSILEPTVNISMIPCEAVKLIYPKSGYYCKIPFGQFVVDSCKRDSSNMRKRKVEAYSPVATFDWQVHNPATLYHRSKERTSTSKSIKPYKECIEMTVLGELGSYAFDSNIFPHEKMEEDYHIRGEIFSRDMIYENASTGVKFTYQWCLGVSESVVDVENGYLEASETLPTEDDIYDCLVNMFSKNSSTIRSKNSAVYGDMNTILNGSSKEYWKKQIETGIKNRTRLTPYLSDENLFGQSIKGDCVISDLNQISDLRYVSRIHIFTKNIPTTSIGMAIDVEDSLPSEYVPDVYKFDISNIHYIEKPYVRVRKEGTTNYFAIQEPPIENIKDALESMCEMHGGFGKFDRQGNFLIDYLLPNDKLFYPSATLYPSSDLYPMTNGEDLSVNKSMYSSCWYDDEFTKPYSRVWATYKLADGTEQMAEYWMVDQDNYDPDKYQEYDMSDNYYFKNFAYTEDEMSAILETVGEKIKSIKYKPFDLEMVGMPQLEAGDALMIKTNEGKFFSYVLRRTLRGIQALKDMLTSD